VRAFVRQRLFKWKTGLDSDVEERSRNAFWEIQELENGSQRAHISNVTLKATFLARARNDHRAAAGGAYG
jgi:hypothetical protein